MVHEQNLSEQFDHVVENADDFEATSLNVARFIHHRLRNHGNFIRSVADILHGKFLGHPLHPVLTDVTIGGWALGTFFDVLGHLTKSKKTQRTADDLITLGTISAVPTAITGMTDFSAIKKDAAAYGAMHSILNSLALISYAASTFARRSGKRDQALAYSLVGMTIATASAWLGGDLVYRHRIGVNHATPTETDEWVSVLPLNHLQESTLTRVEMNETPILLFRQGNEVHAIGAVCSHAGGPLEEGKLLENECVECPWHQSVFDLKTGHVVHSPSTYNQPRYSVRIRDGQIQLRNWRLDDRTEIIDNSLYDAPASQPEVLPEAKPDKQRPSQAEGERDPSKYRR